MSIEEDHLDLLQNIEAVVAAIYRKYPETTDYDVEKAYSALIQTYRGEAAGKPAGKPSGNLALMIYEQVAAMINWRLGREQPDHSGNPLPPVEPVQKETVDLCLKRLRKSIQTWTKQGGRQGYLTYISQFL